MKRFIGWLLVLVGGVATAWGGVSLLTGSTHTRVELVPNLATDAFTGGLVGLAVLTVGLIWVRD